MSSERKQLEDEITYYMGVLASRKVTKPTSHTSSQIQRDHIGAYSSITNHRHGSTYPVGLSQSSRRVVINSRGNPSQTSISSRKVVLTSGSKRTVLNPGTSQSIHLSNTNQSTPTTSDHLFSDKSLHQRTNTYKWVNSDTNTRKTAQTEQYRNLYSKSNLPPSASIKSGVRISPQRATTSGSLHIQPNQPFVKSTTHQTIPLVSQSSSQPNILVKSKYKLVKSTTTSMSTSSRNVSKAATLPLTNSIKPLSSTDNATTSSAEDKFYRKGKYKLIKGSVAEREKLLRELEKTSKLIARVKTTKQAASAKQSGVIVSRFKLNRQKPQPLKSLTKPSKAFNTPYKLNKALQLKKSPYRLIRNTKNTPRLHTRFKLDRRELPRKSAGSSSLMSRRRSGDRKSTPGRAIPSFSQTAFISPFKLVRTKASLASTSKSKGPVTPVSLRSSRTPESSNYVRKRASRALHRSAVTSLKAKYQKNNANDKQCLFFIRYGVCKRGEKCFYEHNKDRIAVCTRYLRGTCTIENCRFSHEPRKEKVPVCQHYLRGVCARDECPYLHVNVGKNAPVCQNFAKYRYCHLGEKCTKLHTDTCPDRDEKGGCPKGKSCKLRHPIRGQKSGVATSLFSAPSAKDIAVDEGPVLGHGEKLNEPLPAYISLKRASSDQRVSIFSKVTKLKTKPEFLE